MFNENDKPCQVARVEVEVVVAGRVPKEGRDLWQPRKVYHITEEERTDGRQQVSAYKKDGSALDKVSADYSSTGMCRQLANSLLWI